jgi:CelD/BcsL family acetyltransferase involved in cellulose biosynthesis
LTPVPTIPLQVYTLNPLEDARWSELLRNHPAVSIFHTLGWIDAVRRTYDYEPTVYTTAPPGEALANGIVLCRVQSWLTGCRLVSVPFADHCDPLVESSAERTALADALKADTHGACRYVELRPTAPCCWHDPSCRVAASFRLHTLDLRPSANELLRRTHPSTVQRRIRHAEREGLLCEGGRSEALLTAFYRLMVSTRRRHGLPPQPIEWFRNIVTCLGDAVTIRVASRDGRPLGSIMTLQHRKTLVYKYGCSDADFHSLGTMPFLFWQAIRDAKERGLETFDLGRTDLSNQGLITFKERLGAVASDLTYFRCSERATRSRKVGSASVLGRLVARLPEPLFVAAGKFLYRHVG